MTNHLEVKAHPAFLDTMRDNCLDEKRQARKRRVDVDPGFAKAMEGFIKKPDYKKIERISKLRTQEGRLM